MPYISSEDVKAKRKAINLTFPKKDGWKISVRKENHSGIQVSILEGPVKLVEEDYAQLNPYNLRGINQEATDILRAIHEIASAGKRVQHVDADYGSIPNFYVSIDVGRWDCGYRTLSVR